MSKRGSFARPLMYFEPLPRMNVALHRLQEAFPKDEEKIPAGLQALFQMLAQMSLDDVGRWGELLSEVQRDMLCRFFTEAPSARVVLAIMVLLDHLRDDRTEQVMRFFFLMDPTNRDMAELAARRDKLNFIGNLAGPTRWIDQYLAQNPRPELLPWLQDKISQGQISQKELISGFSHQAPLFRRLTDFFFEEGGALLAELQPEWAAERVDYHFRRDHVPLVLNYLRHYPTRFWKPEFLQALYRAKGEPDPAVGGFWQKLDRGTLWRVRRVLFEPMMEPLSGDRLVLWQRWLHRCIDWKIRQGIAHIYVGPFQIVEEPDASMVFPKENALDPVEIIDYDGRWAQRMEKLLSEYVQWG